MPYGLLRKKPFLQSLSSASVGAKRVPLAHSTCKQSESADLLRKLLLFHVWLGIKP